MDAVTVISNNYSRVVTQYNKIIRINECLRKENKDIQAQKYNVLKAYEKLKLLAMRQNRKLIIDQQMRGDENNVKISNFCEDSHSCGSSTETATKIATKNSCCDSVKLSECSTDTDISDCDNLSQLLRDIELIFGTKTACNAHFKLITRLKNTVINAMQLDLSNEENLNKQQEEINHYIKQIDDLKHKNECKAIDISRMKQNISELAGALKGQFLENKKLKKYNTDEYCVTDEYLRNQQDLECKLSEAEKQCNDLTIYNAELENNLKEEHADNCEKADIIFNLQEQQQYYNSKLDELDYQITLSVNEFAKFKEEHCTCNHTIDVLKENNSILEIELKSVNSKLNNSMMMDDENRILKKSVENLENALEFFKYENNSLMENSIKDRLEVLWSIVKIHISENKIKQYDENITELNNCIECGAAKYCKIQKEIEICNLKLCKKSEDYKDLQLQLMDTQKCLDIARENLKCAQLQDKENSAIKMHGEETKCISSISTQSEISNSTEPVPVPVTVIETEVPKIVPQAEISNSTESVPVPVTVIETEVPKTVPQTEIANSAEPILSAIETKSPDVQRGQSPKVDEKYEKNGLSESTRNEEEIEQMSLEHTAVQSDINKNLQINCMTSKLDDTRMQKRINKLAASPSDHKLHFKSNTSIQKTCKLPTDISSCTSSDDSSATNSDCIESYIQKLVKKLPEELQTIERKEKQYKSRIHNNDLQNRYSHKNHSPTETYDFNTHYSDISLENVEIYTASVSNKIDNISQKAKGDQLKNVNALQEISQNVNKNREDISLKAKGDKLKNVNVLQKESQNVNENREDEKMEKHKKPALAKQNSIEQIKTTKLKIQKHSTKQTKKPKKKIMSSKTTSHKPEFRFNLPCTSCDDENCYYNKTVPKTPEECQIFLEQIMAGKSRS